MARGHCREPNQKSALASKLYRRHEILVGRQATKERFVEMAPDFDVVHFGGHAFVNPEFPLLSRLAFAGEAGTEQSLFAHEIARIRFPRTRVVVLAACSTAAGVVSRGEGVVSVARPFLGAGVPLVVASQWDVDDRATEQLTLVVSPRAREVGRSGSGVARGAARHAAQRRRRTGAAGKLGRIRCRRNYRIGRRSVTSREEETSCCQFA